jgi:hypothetical protein
MRLGVSKHGRKKGERERRRARDNSFIPMNQCARSAHLGIGAVVIASAPVITPCQVKNGSLFSESLQRSKNVNEKGLVRDVSFDQLWQSIDLPGTDKAKGKRSLASHVNVVASHVPRVLSSGSQVRSSMLRC